MGAVQRNLSHTRPSDIPHSRGQAGPLIVSDAPHRPIQRRVRCHWWDVRLVSPTIRFGPPAPEFVCILVWPG